MRTNHATSNKGSILVIALMTITILTLICATSLYVTSQNTTTAVQAASWQQALTAAETGVDAAVRALNNDTWDNWISMGQSGTNLPISEPALSSSQEASGRPDSTHYNYLPSSNLVIALPNSEGATGVKAWVMIDTAGMSPLQDTNNKQWYRVRATGIAAAPRPIRVSNNRLDNDLRMISLRYDRKGQTALNNSPQATRSIEVIMQPLAASNGVRGITAVKWLSFSGAMVIDSFDSGNPFKSTNGLYDANKRQNHGDVATTNSTNSDFRNTYVYGSVAYSGPPIKNTTNVQGTISTPFDVTIPPVTQPDWTGKTYTQYTGGGSNPPNSGVFTAGPTGNPALIKINGDLVVSSSGLPLHIAHYDSSGTPTAPGSSIVIWVTGQLKTQGSGYISQDSNVQVTWYVGKDITVSGSSYQNQSGIASNLSILGYGPIGSKATVSGSANFIGTMNIPNYATTVSGGGDWCGGLVTQNLTMSGDSDFHYDEALNRGGNTGIGNYAFASWFEDNSAPTRGITY